MASRKITELPQLLELDESDINLLIIETALGTRAISYNKLTKNLDNRVDKIEKLHVNNAAAHNGIFRGRNLTNIYTIDEICSRIANGSFEDLYIGDYFDITISTEYTASEVVRCVLAGFDTYLNNGDTPLTRHHAVIVPKNCFAKTHQMNPTNTTAGGYVGSNFATVLLGKYSEAIATAIGSSHLISRRTLLTKSISETGASMAGAGFTGYSNGWDWYDRKLQLLSEIQVYGSNVFSSSFYDTGIDNLQLPLFALNPAAKVCKLGGVDDVNASNRVWWWLRNVASASLFAHVNNNGYSGYNSASLSFGVRPLFCIG